MEQGRHETPQRWKMMEIGMTRRWGEMEREERGWVRLPKRNTVKCPLRRT